MQTDKNEEINIPTMIILMSHVTMIHRTKLISPFGKINNIHRECTGTKTIVDYGVPKKQKASYYKQKVQVKGGIKSLSAKDS